MVTILLLSQRLYTPGGNAFHVRIFVNKMDFSFLTWTACCFLCFSGTNVLISVATENRQRAEKAAPGVKKNVSEIRKFGGVIPFVRLQNDT